MKKKRFIKKSIALVLAVFALMSAVSLTAFADTVTVSNGLVNAYDDYEVTTSSTYTITGYMTYAVASDLNFSGMTVAGKTNSYTRSSVISVTSPKTGYSRTMTMTAKKTNGTTISSLSYTGSGSINGNASYMGKTATCLYYILVDSTTKSVSASRTYVAYPSITSQI